MSTETATPETGTVDAPVSMESIIADIASGEGSPNEGVTAESVADELVEDAEKAGDAPEAAEREDSATEAKDEAETPADEPQEQTNEAEPAYKVTVAGEEVEVPLSELLKGYSRERDYTAKTMALGEERRALEATKATLETTLQTQYAQELQQQISVFENADPVLAQARQMTAQQWDQMKRDDPAQFVEWQDAINSRVAAIESARTQVQQIEQKRQTEAQEAEQAAMAEQSEKAAQALVEVMPDLADPAKFEGFVTQTFDYLKGQGLKGDELRDLIHPVALTIADKARKYDEMQKAQAALPSKKVIPQPVARPLKTDAGNSERAPTPRFPASAGIDRKADWVASQILNSG